MTDASRDQLIRDLSSSPEAEGSYALAPSALA